MRPDLRDYQQEFVGNIHLAVDEGHTSIIGVSPTGCHAIDTGILMFDGSIKPVQSIEIGDQIMGPDSTPRTVLTLHHGHDTMFRIVPTKGEPFIVNGDHILNLKATQEGRGVKRQNANISVRNYLLENKTFKHVYKLWRTPVDFTPQVSPLPIEPYFLGLFLGDGSMRHKMVTTMDQEIANECYRQAEIFGLNIRVEAMAGNRASNYHLATYNGGGGTNPLKAWFRKLGLLNTTCDDKFIPAVYKTASRQSRLELLAGLIDSDGSLGHGFDYITKSPVLAADVVFLAKSLGFAAYKKEKWVNGTCYYRLSISGDLSQVPCRLKRKQAEPRKQIKDVLVTGFKVEALSEDKYYGFEVDKDHLYLTSDFCVHHNSGKTVCFIDMAVDAASNGNIVYILVHRKQLVKQTSKALTKFGVPHGVISAGHPVTDELIQVCSIQTLVRRLKKFVPADLIITDEAHHLVSSMYQKVYDWAPNALKINVTATPERADGKGFDKECTAMVLGWQIYRLIEAGWLCEPHLYGPDGEAEPIDLDHLHTLGGDYKLDELDRVMDKPKITGDAVKQYKKVCPDYPPTVVFCVSIKHAQHVAADFNAAGIPAESIDGSMDDETRDGILERLANGTTKVVTSCDLISEGFDLPAIGCVILLRPTKSLALYLQQVGRALRPAAGKSHTIILDHVKNYLEHGPVEMHRDWTLEGSKRSKKKKGASLMTCDNCYATFPPAAECPRCGKLMKKAVGEGSGVEIEQVEGELVRIDTSKLLRLRAIGVEDGKQTLRRLERA